MKTQQIFLGWQEKLSHGSDSWITHDSNIKNMDKTSYFMKGSSWHMGYHRNFTNFSFDEGRKNVERGEVSSKAEYVWLNIAIFEVKSEGVCYIRREKSRQKMLSFENLRTNSSDDFADKKL